MSFAKELQTIYQAKKAELLEKKDENLERRAKDITLFFEKEIRDNAKDRMRVRAEQGRPTANILEYQYNERFYVNEEGDIVRFVEKEVNYPNYRIHDVVIRDRVFQALLVDFEREISTAEAPIQVMKWRPRESLYVIETVWGKNRYHNPYGYEEERGRSSVRGRAPRGRGGGVIVSREMTRIRDRMANGRFDVLPSLGGGF